MSDENDVQNDMPIVEKDLLSIANNILNLLECQERLTDEEDLFLDDFYISILKSILSDNKIDFEPGETLEEKVKNLNKLIKYLSEIIETDLSQIDGEDIVKNHDKEMTRILLELFEELIKTLLNSNLEEEDEEAGSTDKKEKKNNSDSNINKRKYNSENLIRGKMISGLEDDKMDEEEYLDFEQFRPDEDDDIDTNKDIIKKKKKKKITKKIRIRKKILKKPIKNLMRMMNMI